MADRQIDNLRRVAQRRAQAAGRKIERLRASGIIVSGSEFDPRRDAAKVARYNSRQVNAYIRNLENFTKNAQFVPSAGGKAIPVAAAARFERTKARFNTYVDKYRESFKDLVVDLADGSAPLTVEQKNKIGSDDWKTFAKGRSAQRPLAHSESEIENIEGIDKLRKLEQFMRDKMKADYLPSRIERGREEAKKMVAQLNNPELQAEIDKLNDFQFGVAWHELGLADSLSQTYWTVMNADNADAAKMQDAAMGDTRKLVKWAQGISPIKR